MGGWVASVSEWDEGSLWGVRDDLHNTQAKGAKEGELERPLDLEAVQVRHREEEHDKVGRQADGGRRDPQRRDVAAVAVGERPVPEKVEGAADGQGSNGHDGRAMFCQSSRSSR